MTESKWIRFTPVPTPAPRKTGVWDVVAKDGGAVLGRISWYAPWRKYVFWPAADTLFEPTCLGDITGFICDRMMDRSIERQRGGTA